MKKINLILVVLMALMLMGMNAQTQLWGTTSQGGTYNGGTLFNINNDATSFNIVHEFNTTDSTGSNPIGDLVQASNGKIYGVNYFLTDFFGPLGGTIFCFDPITNIYSDIHVFISSSGTNPTGGLVEASNHILYGLAGTQGINNKGVIYSIDPSTNTYTDVFNFDSASGYYPNGKLFSLNNKLYGINTCGGLNNTGVLFSYDISTNIYSIHYNFNVQNPCIGYTYYGTLMQCTNGKLYGLRVFGGDTNHFNGPNQAEGAGLLFSFDTITNTFTDLYNFNDTLGGNPSGSLIQGLNGKLYGITIWGGTSSHNNGVIFSFDIDSNLYVDIANLYDNDGSHSYGSLIQLSDGNLYGMTTGGDIGYGELFSYDITNNFFNDILDLDSINGAIPLSSLITLSPTTNMRSITNTPTLTLFPNPASTTITLHSPTPLPHSQLIITDVLGNTICQQFITNNSSLTTQIDVSTWSEGVYFYEVRGANDIYRGKFLKE